MTFTLNPKPLNRKPYTLHPKPQTPVGSPEAGNLILDSAPAMSKRPEGALVSLIDMGV